MATPPKEQDDDKKHAQKSRSAPGKGAVHPLYGMASPPAKPTQNWRQTDGMG